MKTITITELKELSTQLTDKIPYLKMLVLFGSRATGQQKANSDWDFAVFYDEEMRLNYIINDFSQFETSGIIAQMFNISDRETHIDVVEINHCSPLLAHFVARDGKVLYEREKGEFEKFRQQALLSKLEIKQIEETKRQNIEHFLQRWSL